MTSALTYDLMQSGRSIHQLGTPALSWEEVKAFIDWAPPSSAIRRLNDPLAEYRSPQAQLIATAVDTLAWANWQRARRKSAKKPVAVMDQLKAAVDRAKRINKGPKNAAQIRNTRAELARRRKQQRERQKLV